MSNNGPNFREVIEGAAHFVDLWKTATEGRDPNTRNSITDVEEMTIGEALSNFGQHAATPEVDGSSVSTGPRLHMDETDTGAEVAIDTAGTDLNPSDMDVEEEDGGVRISEGDWATFINIDGSVQNTETKNAGQIFTSSIEIERDEDSESGDGESNDEETN